MPRINPQYTLPEHLGDPYLGAWYVEDVFTEHEAATVIDEVESSGAVEPIWENTMSSVNQVFRRLLIDMRKEHDFPRVTALGQKLATFAIENAGDRFPKLTGFTIDEAAVQIYPANTKLALGWHKDHKADELMVISTTLAGGGVLSFTEKTPHFEATDNDIIAGIHTKPHSAVYLRANGLYEREDGSDIRVAHAVTAIDPDEERFTIQFRMGVNAGDYGNRHVNSDRPFIA